MFSIYANVGLGGAFVPIHDPQLEAKGLICVNPKLTERVNAHGSLEFTIYATNPHFRDMATRSVFVKVYDDVNEIWRGRVISTTRDINNSKKVFCEGEMSYLCDTVQYPRIYNGTTDKLLKKLLANHNALMSGTGKEIKFGTVTATYDADQQAFTNVEVVTDKAMTTWEAIQSLLVKQFGGYLRTRKQGNDVYLDWLADFVDGNGDPDETNQQIKFGKNLLSFVEKVDSSNVVTALLPFGAKKNTAPILYKRRSSSSKYFDRLTGEMEAGQYLIYSNGGALNRVGIVDANNNRIRLHSTLLDFDMAKIVVDDENEHPDYIRITGDISDVTIWTIQKSTFPATKVVVSGSVSKSISVSDGVSSSSMTESVTISSSGAVSTSSFSSGSAQFSVVDPEDPTIEVGKTNNVSISASTASGGNQISAETEKNTDDSWFIYHEPSSTKYFLASTGVADQLTYVSANTNTTDKKLFWQITNDENGATITNKYNSENDIPAVIHGDVDAGWRCAENATAEMAVPQRSAVWTGNRVNIQRSNRAVQQNIQLYVSSDVGTLLFGWIYGTEVFDSITTPFELKEVALNRVHKTALEQVSITATAVDLSFSSVSVDSLKVGKYSTIISEPLGIKLLMLCVQKTTFLSQPDKTSVTFGVGQKTITDIQGGQTANVR